MSRLGVLAERAGFELSVPSLLERRIRAVSPFTDRRVMIGAGRLVVRLACRVAAASPG
jgi:hypothetical protein